MTRNESFKRRIRARMTETGERYGAARRILLEQADRRTASTDDAPGRRVWVSDPGHTADAIREATGRGWDEWADLLDAWPGHDDGHTAIATYVRDELGVDGWWAQTVTVGYERISGRRLPHQRADGTFSVSTSRTITVDHEALRDLLLDADGRATLFPTLETTLRSRPTTRDVRLGVGGGVALIHADARDDGRTAITVAHEQLTAPEDVPLWRGFWADWLEALDEA